MARERVLVRVTVRDRALLVPCRVSSGTCTTTKPDRDEPGYQPAPPPGFMWVVPKNRPLIDMYTCSGFA